MFYKVFGDGSIGKFSHPNGCHIVSHLLYIDDLLIFTNGERRSLNKLLKVLELYGSWFSQDINKAKLAFFSPIKLVRREGGDFLV